MTANPMAFGLTLTLPTLLFFFTFYKAYVLPLWVSVRVRLTIALP